MTDTLQNHPTPNSLSRKIGFSCGTFALVASLTLSLAAIATAVLVLLGILP